MQNVLATGCLTIRHSAHPGQPDRSAPVTQHSASTLTGTSSACYCYWPCPCHSLGPFQNLGDITAVSSVICCQVLWGPAHFFTRGVGPAACSSAGCARVHACGSFKPSGAKSWLQGLLSIALVCCPCQAQTSRQPKSLQSLSPDGQLPFSPPLLADPAPAQTCQTRSQPGWHLRGPKALLVTAAATTTARQPRQLPSAATDDTIVLGAFGNHPRQAEWRKLWELAGLKKAAQGSVVAHTAWLCDVRGFQSLHWQSHARAGIACCSAPTQPQTISHMFLDCLWLPRLSVGFAAFGERCKLHA